MKLPVLILSILFLFATASITFCVQADQKDSITFSDEEISNNAEEGKDDKSDNSLREVELLAYLPNNFEPFSLALKQTFDIYNKSYISPIKIYDNPPPEC